MLMKNLYHKSPSPKAMQAEERQMTQFSSLFRTRRYTSRVTWKEYMEMHELVRSGITKEYSEVVDGLVVDLLTRGRSLPADR